MKYQKIINLLENTPNQPSKLRIQKLVEVNDDSRGTYNTNSQIKFKNSTLKSSLRDYSDPYILAKGTIYIQYVATPAADNDGKEIIFKNCSSLTDCISETIHK